jgi:hypothetical protein
MSVPLCIKSNGQLRVLVGSVAACDSSEQRTDWVVGAELGAGADFDLAEAVLPGDVTLSCSEQDGDPDLSFQDLKITAIEATSLSNVFIGT